MMQDEEASRSRTCILPENEKQNIVASENNLKSMRVPWIHKEKGSGIHQKIEFDKKSMFIDNSLKTEFPLVVTMCLNSKKKT